MIKTSDQRTPDITFWSRRLGQLSSRLAAVVATRISRLLIVLVFIVVALYVSYQQAWQPLVATAPLPPGVAERSPQLNTDLLKHINAQRAERVEARPQQFNVDTLIQPLPAP